MYSNFMEHGMEYAKQAVKEDDTGNYSNALKLYMNALEYFQAQLKYEKNQQIVKTIRERCMGYLRRAEEIRAVLDNGGSVPAPNGGVSVAAQPKTSPKPKDGGGKDKEDPEQAKLKAGLDSVIIREKPNVKWSDVAGLENAKQALQEAVILPVKFPQFFTG